ncbi:hypothetical protein Droror1_Dr00015220 [Drosera rotundifolia]
MKLDKGQGREDRAVSLSSTGPNDNHQRLPPVPAAAPTTDGTIELPQHQALLPSTTKEFNTGEKNASRRGAVCLSSSGNGLWDAGHRTVARQQANKAGERLRGPCRGGDVSFGPSLKVGHHIWAIWSWGWSDITVCRAAQNTHAGKLIKATKATRRGAP